MSTPDGSVDRWRFALVGAGVIGAHHGNFISELAGHDPVGTDPADKLMGSGKGLTENRQPVGLMVGAYGSARIGRAVTVS